VEARGDGYPTHTGWKSVCSSLSSLTRIGISWVVAATSGPPGFVS
jgi:hypothetical protein